MFSGIKCVYFIINTVKYYQLVIKKFIFFSSHLQIERWPDTAPLPPTSPMPSHCLLPLNDKLFSLSKVSCGRDVAFFIYQILEKKWLTKYWPRQTGSIIMYRYWKLEKKNCLHHRPAPQWLFLRLCSQF